MLITPKLRHVDPSMQSILTTISNGDLSTTQPRKGCFVINHFNFDHFLQEGWERWPSFENWEHNPYGVCDSVEQFFETGLGKFVESSERKFCISFTCVRKANQSDWGGWRWHKWGPYIGKQNAPTTEYLYDEPEVEEVYCYHVYEKTS